MKPTITAQAAYKSLFDTDTLPADFDSVYLGYFTAASRVLPPALIDALELFDSYDDGAHDGIIHSELDARDMLQDIADNDSIVSLKGHHFLRS